MKRALLVILLIAVSASSKFLWADPSHFSKSPILGLTPEEEVDLKAKINEIQDKIMECKEKIEEVSIYTEEAQSHLEDVKSEVDNIIMIPIDDEIGFEIGNLSTENILDLIVDQSTSSELEELVTIKQQTLNNCIGYLTSVNNRYSEIKAAIKQLVIDGATRYQNRIVEASIAIEKCRSQNAVDAKKILEYDTQEAKYAQLISQITLVQIQIQQKRSNFGSLESLLINKIEALINRNRKSESDKPNLILIDSSKGAFGKEISNDLNGLGKRLSLKTCEYSYNSGSIIFGRFRGDKERNCIETSYIPPTNIIYVLDISGSMDSNMGLLRDSVSRTYDLILAQPEAVNKIKSTIIVYDDNAEYVLENALISKSDISKIPPSRGGTDFEKPLNLAYKTIEKYLSLYENFTIIFMSDGDASMPYNSIKLFNSNPRIINKTKFNFVEFGGNNKLKQISDQLNGKYYQISKPDQLDKQFIEIVKSINCPDDD